jgi:hypothetical protein
VLSRLQEVVIQQPEGDDKPEVPATPVPLLGMAKLDVSVIVAVPPHGPADASGVGTTISGTKGVPPTPVLVDGIVASLNAGPVTALGSDSVDAALLLEELAAVAVGVGLHVPSMDEVPNEVVIGSDATEGGDGEPVVAGVPVGLLAATAVLVAELVTPIVGHSVIAPKELPEIGPRVPILSCAAPNGLPVAPTVGIVPGMAVGDAVAGDIVGVVGARRVFVELTWATAVP